MDNSGSENRVEQALNDADASNALVAERDQYKEALEYIVQRQYTGASWVARQALKGEAWQ